MKHYDLVIATPGRAMEAEYVKSLVETMEWLSSRGMTYKYLNRYSSLVSSAREKTAVDSDVHDWTMKGLGDGRWTYDWVLWVDSDVSWKVKDLEMLMKADLDIVGGCVPVSLEGDIGAMKLVGGVPNRIHWNDLALEFEPVQVDGVAFGFLLVRSGVFEKMKRPWFRFREIAVEGAEFPVVVGEDYSWCMGAADAGFSVYLHPGVSVGHSKDVIMRL